MPGLSSEDWVFLFLGRWKMKIGIHKESRVMKLFFSLSFLIHLSFFSVATLLFSNFKMDPLPTVHVEVFLYPWVSEEKPTKAPIKKEEKEILPPSSPKVEVRETSVRKLPVNEPSVNELPAKELLVKELPVKELLAKELLAEEPPVSEPAIDEPAGSEPNPVPLEDRTEEVRGEEEERGKVEPIFQATNSVPGLPKDNHSVPQVPSPLTTPSEEESKEIVKYSSLSEGEIALIHPKYVENPKPFYPREARKKGYQGEVVLRVEILSNGRVGQMEVKKSSGHEILDRSALSAVKQWKFLPAKRGENAIPLWVNIPIKFQLQ
jgi:protein TonB